MRVFKMLPLVLPASISRISSDFMPESESVRSGWPRSSVRAQGNKWIHGLECRMEPDGGEDVILERLGPNMSVVIVG